MRRIHQIIYQEIAPPSLIALIVLTFVVFTREFGRISRLMLQQNSDPGLVAEMALSILPQILIYTIPLSFLIGTLVGFSRLSTDSEVVAFRAAGVSIYQIIWPVLKASLGVALLTGLMTFVLFPKGNSNLAALRQELGARPLQSEIKSRVFFEELPGKLLYVEDQDLQTAQWKGVFLAENTGPEGERLILSRSGRLIISPDNQRLQLNFDDALSYEINPDSPETYKWARFQTLEVPVPRPENGLQVDQPKRPREKSLEEIRLDIAHGTVDERRFSLVELNRRIALPVSALLFAILGVTLGSRPHRGGRAYGLVVGMTIAFAYYALLEAGVKAAEDRVFSIPAGLWGPNISLFLIALLSLRVARQHSGFAGSLGERRLVVTAVSALRSAWQAAAGALRRLGRRLRDHIWNMPQVIPRVAKVVDLYVMRIFVLNLLLTLLACLSLYYLFTFFDLINDIFSNRIDYALVVEYFLYLLPQVLSLLVPISTLIATMITFGTLEKTNQIVALKACGVSVYQAALPLFGVALALSGLAYLNQEYVMPFANQRQDSLRALIKGRPVQTHYTPGHNWIFGEGNRLYNYHHFDPDRDRFAEIDVYELDIASNSLIAHTHARQADWDRDRQSWRFQSGWTLRFADSGHDRFERYSERWLRLPEGPDYFEAEVRESSKMTYPELRRYIQSLQQGGFEVDHLRTELYTKLSFPAVPLIMSMLGIPFAFTLGRKGALYGIAAGILIGIVYWGAFGVFGVLGAGGLLGPLLAAWAPNVIFGAGGAFLFLTIRT